MTDWSTLKKLIWLRIIKGGGSALRTVTGAIVHVTNALALPAKALTVNVEPIQDLHGYENPWPAGGGVNKILLSTESLSGSAYGVSYNYNPTTEVVTFSGTNSDASAHGILNRTKVQGIKVPTNLQPGDSYSYGANLPVGMYSQIVYKRSTDGSLTTLKYLSGTGQFFALTGTIPADFAEIVRIDFGVNSSATVSGQARIIFTIGSTAPTSWSPYSNICPISGRTSATVTRTGKNLANMFNDGKVPSVSNGLLVTANGYRSDFIPFKANAAFTFHITGAVVYMMCYDKDKNFLSAFTNNEGTITNTTPANTAYVMLRKDNNTAPTDAQLEYGTASDYQPYVGTTYTIQLGDTVYGGTLDVTNGVLTVDRAMVDLGTLNYGYNATGRFYNTTPITGFKRATTTNERATGLVCSIYKASTNLSFSDAQDNYSWLRAQTTAGYDFTVKDTRFSTGSDFKTAMSGVQLCYELATPIEITLTPTQVELLQGENNIWSDGEITLTYLADGNASDVEALNILLGNRYVNNHGEDEPTDREALDILLGR